MRCTAVVALWVLIVVAGVSACGGDGSPGEVGGAVIAVGGSPLTVSDGNLELTIEAVRDRGDSVSTGDGTLSVNSAKSGTHTIFELPFTAKVVDGDQWGLAFESLAVNAGETAVDVALVCHSSSCGGTTSSFGIFAGAPSDFLLYVVAESGVESFEVEFTGATVWPPEELGTAPNVPDSPAPADTVAEVTP